MKVVVEFFDMGGYAGYVWPAYGLAAVILIGLCVLSLRGLRAQERRLAQLEARREKGAGREAKT